MAVKILYTSPDLKGVTESLFREALKHPDGVRSHAGAGRPHPDYSGILYLAPHSGKAREAGRIFHGIVATESGDGQSKKKSGSVCYIPPEISTISEFSKKIHSLYGEGRILDRPLIPVVLSRLSGKGLGFSSLVANLISDIKRYYPDRGVNELTMMFYDIFRELNIPGAVQSVPLECLEIMNKYDQFMRERSLVDGDDVIRDLPGHLCLKGRSILVADGFGDPDSAEVNVLLHLIRNSELSLIAVPDDARTSGLSDRFMGFLKENFAVDEANVTDRGNAPYLYYCSYADPEEEVEGIARNIKSLYVSGKFRDLGKTVVAFPFLGSYAPIIERVFKRYGIPFVLSQGRAVGRRKPFLDIACLLSSMAEGYPRLKFAQFLSSHYFGKLPASLKQWMPSLSLQSGIIEGKETWLNVIDEGSETFEIDAAVKDDLRNELGDVFRVLKSLEADGTAMFDTFALALVRIVGELGFRQESPETGDAKDRVSVQDEKEALDQVLEQTVLLGDLLGESVTIAEFSEVLIHLLNAALIEEEGEGVAVMEFSDVVGICPEYLFLGGLTDESMPGRQDTDYILPDSVKRELGFMYLDKYLEMRRLTFNSVVSSSGHVHLSYPVMDGDRRYIPSAFLYTGEEIREKIPGIFSMEEHLVMRGRGPLSAYISEIGIPRSEAGFGSYLRVTDIDAYRFCPRKFFIERVASVTPPDIKEYEVEAITLGNILHKIMERIIQGPLEDFESMRKRAEQVAEEVVNSRKIGGYWKGLIKDTFLELLPDIYEREIEIRGEGYTDSVLENTIVGEPVKGIRLKGKIDRFDRIGNAIQIIDYKTGTARLACSQVEEGNENLQLFLYAAIMKNLGYSVERVGIYSLRDVQVKWCPPRKRAGRKQETMDDYIISSLKHLESAVKGIRDGDFMAHPLDEYNCRNCHEYSFCPYIQQ